MNGPTELSLNAGLLAAPVSTIPLMLGWKPLQETSSPPLGAAFADQPLPRSLSWISEAFALAFPAAVSLTVGAVASAVATSTPAATIRASNLIAGMVARPEQLLYPDGDPSTLERVRRSRPA